jgi:hypothetical protein
MPGYPGFTVRSYPAFRPARLYRVLVPSDAVYFIRLKGLIGISDAGADSPFVPRRQAVVGSLIRKFAQESIASGLAEVERGDPEEMVRSSKKHFKLLAADFVSSSLDPHPLFGAQGPSFARWKVIAKGHHDTYHIEEEESLRGALEQLPGLLGSRLTVNAKLSGG